MTILKYHLVAIPGIEFNLVTGWMMSESIKHNSEEYNTKEEAVNFKPAFIAGLKITESDVWEILLITVSYKIDNESGIQIESSKNEIERRRLNLIDASENRIKFEYILLGRYGIGMASPDIYELSYPLMKDLSRNQFLKRYEHGYCAFDPVEVFQSEAEARRYILKNNIKLSESVIDFGI